MIHRSVLRAQCDRRLVELIGDGCEPAFEVLVQRHRHALLAYARRMPVTAERAEEIVQTALLSAWRSLRDGAAVREPRSWLFQITHNAALTALQERRHDHAQLDERLPGGVAPQDDLERRAAVRRALASVAALPDSQREALLRTAVDGQSHSEVARALGTNEGAVRGLVYRARATLRSAATALTPAPLLSWASAAEARGAPLVGRIGEFVGAGTVGGGALAAKLGATVAVTGALAGGGVVVERTLDGDRRPDGIAAAAARTVTPVAGAQAIAADAPPAGTQGIAGGIAADGSDRTGARATPARGRDGRAGDPRTRAAGSPLAASAPAGSDATPPSRQADPERRADLADEPDKASHDPGRAAEDDEDRDDGDNDAREKDLGDAADDGDDEPQSSSRSDDEAPGDADHEPAPSESADAPLADRGDGDEPAAPEPQLPPDERSGSEPVERAGDD